ncbi:hypothetical protein GCM10007933_43250 [Zoogloea oryzae]|uniref:Uncharacterized protein n=1 Tax=Zoogloea oryzae TaxID=310767 RepID=A0ABQ6FL57_9RHOO|nr:hypothetical protein GCM10007933_43250 [Zoogloea oryzae]
MTNNGESSNFNQPIVSENSNTTIQIVAMQSDAPNFTSGIKLDDNKTHYGIKS